VRPPEQVADALNGVGRYDLESLVTTYGPEVVLVPYYHETMHDQSHSAPSIEASESNPAIVEQLRQEIAGAGPITFARFMEVALYDPVDGYYVREKRRPGRGGDFITAPESSAYFGLTLARQLAECWERLDRPETWAIREFGSGVGGLAYDLIAGLSTEAPAAAEGLRYHMAELNLAQRREAMSAMREVGLASKIVLEDPNDDLPPITGLVLANEVADALPVHRLVRTDQGWIEQYVDWRNGWFTWSDGPVSPEAEPVVTALEAEGIDWNPGDVADVSPAASAWFERAASGLERGYAILIDYGYAARELYQAHRLQGTIRGYFEHSVTDDPFRRIGNQDLTAHVDFTALQRAGESAGMVPAGLTTQGAFLASLDLGEFLLRLQQEEGATVADYLSAQSVMRRLIDPGGMGRFGVLMMAKDAPVEPPLAGFLTAPPPF
jgi:SAM-dependent MidA family methyltransferase